MRNMMPRRVSLSTGNKRLWVTESHTPLCRVRSLLGQHFHMVLQELRSEVNSDFQDEHIQILLDGALLWCLLFPGSPRTLADRCLSPYSRCSPLRHTPREHAPRKSSPALLVIVFFFRDGVWTNLLHAHLLLQRTLLLLEHTIALEPRQICA